MAQVDAQPRRIAHRGTCRTRVEQDALTRMFDQEGKPELRLKVPMITCQPVLNQCGDLHGVRCAAWAPVCLVGVDPSLGVEPNQCPTCQ